MIKLFLDDVRSPPDDTWTVCRTAEDARSILDTRDVEFASLDHDLGECEDCESAFPPRGYQVVTSTCRHRWTGYDLVKWMAEHDVWPRNKPAVHSANPYGAANMRATIDRYWHEQPDLLAAMIAAGDANRVGLEAEELAVIANKELS